MFAVIPSIFRAKLNHSWGDIKATFSSSTPLLVTIWTKSPFTLHCINSHHSCPETRYLTSRDFECSSNWMRNDDNIFRVQNIRVIVNSIQKNNLKLTWAIGDFRSSRCVQWSRHDSSRTQRKHLNWDFVIETYVTLVDRVTIPWATGTQSMTTSVLWPKNKSDFLTSVPCSTTLWCSGFNLSNNNWIKINQMIHPWPDTNFSCPRHGAGSNVRWMSTWRERRGLNLMVSLPVHPLYSDLMTQLDDS